jgi:thiol-disulfide isomerase/thioredoxin
MRRIWRPGSPRRMSTTVELTSENWGSVVRDGGLALVLFRTDWCVACARFRPVFDRVSRRHADVVFGTVNIEDERDLAARFEIIDVPTLMVLSDNAVHYALLSVLAEPDLEDLVCQEREAKLGATVAMPVSSLVAAPRIPPGLEALFSQVGGQPWAAVSESRPISPAVTAAEMATSLKSGLQASYATNEGSGLLIADQVGGHTLTLSGAKWGPGFVGPGLVFSGFPAAVTTPGFLDTSKDFSVSAWVWLADASGWHTAISQDATEVSAFYLHYSPVDNAWAFSMLSADSVNARPIRAVAPTAPCIGEWQHLIGVHDAAATQLRLYVNGRLAGVAPFARAWPAAGPFVIGRGLFADMPDWFAGGIDQIRVWDRALCDAEALAVA